jgi:hypothetical protein
MPVNLIKQEEMMGNLAYSTQKPDKIGPNVEEMLRKELGVAQPLPYQVEDAEATKTTINTVLKEGAGLIFGRQEVLLFTLNFQIREPRAAQLQVHLNRQGIGCHGGTLIYSCPLSKSAGGEVSLDDRGRWAGDTGTVAKLGAVRDLAKRLGNFARTQSNVGGVDIRIQRLVRILPQSSGSLLLIATLPKMVSMGFSASLEAKEFFALAGLIEQAL